MRLRIEVTTSAPELPWASVLRPGRSLLYDLLAHGAPGLGRRIHDGGHGPHGMVPFGHGAPVFPGAVRRPGAYAAGGHGVIEAGSPVLEIVQAWADALAGRQLIDWGGVALHMRNIVPVDPPEFAAGRARFRTLTPVVMKGSGRDSEGGRTTRQAWVLPGEPEFAAYLAGNLRRKAETLGLEPDVELDAITWVGPKRSFAVSGGLKPGAADHDQPDFKKFTFASRTVKDLRHWLRTQAIGVTLYSKDPEALVTERQWRLLFDSGYDSSLNRDLLLIAVLERVQSLSPA